MGTVELKDFNDLINLGRVTRVMNIGGHKIVLGTLNSEEYNQAVSRIPADCPEASRMERIQREIIAAAIQSIDGETLDPDAKSKILTLGQLALSNMMYSEYISMIGEQDKLLEDAKKNSSQTQKASSSSPKVIDSK